MSKVHGGDDGGTQTEDKKKNTCLKGSKIIINEDD